MQSLDLGPFRLVEPLGRGGMGVVWHAVHRQSGAVAAVKTLAVRDPVHVEAFQREVRATAGLDHPGVVWMFDAGIVPPAAERASGRTLIAGSPWLGMELVPGGALNPEQILSWPHLRALLVGVLDALAHAHARGVIHRDLKPANLLRSGARWGVPGAVKVVDFGIAHALHGGPDQSEPAGTLHYMAPEQAEGRWYDQGPWTDLYALGCVAWLLVTGRRPFVGHRSATVLEAHARQPLPPFAPRSPVPRELEDWLRIMTAKDPARRFPDAARAALALTQLGAAELGPAELEPSADPPEGEVDTVTLALDDRPSVGLLELDEPAPRWRRRVPADWRPPVSAGRPWLGAGLGLFGLRPLATVGREEERDALWAELRTVATSERPRLVAIAGPRGCGRSQLGRWLGERATEVGAARALTLAGADPVQRARDAVARWLAVHGVDDAGLREARLAAGVPEEVLPWVRALLDPEVALHEATRRTTVRRLAEDAAALGPVIVWIDDADDDGVETARDVVERGSGPVLVVICPREPLPADLEARTIELEPLDAASHGRLVRELLHLDEALAARVDLHTRGRPAFAVGLVRSWIERGLLVDGPRGFALAEADAALPPSLDRMWADRVPPLVAELDGAADALELAACLGVEVDGAEWSALTDSDPVRGPLLDRLLRAGLATGGPERWRFTEPELRDAIRAASGDRWRSWNRRAAERLVGRASDARVGRHQLAAGDPEAAWPLLERAARTPPRASGYPGQLAAIAEAVASLDQLGVDALDARRLEMALQRAAVVNAMGAPAEAEAEARRIEGIAREHGWTALLARALEVRVSFALNDRDPALGERLCREALSLSPADDLRRRARLAYYRAICARHAGDHGAARRLAEEGVHLAEQVGDVDVQCDGWKLLGLAAHLRGDHDEVARWLGPALERYRATANPYGQGDCLNSLASIPLARGDGAEGERLLRESIAAFEAAGSFQSVYPTTNLALRRLAEGDAARALPLLARARDRAIRGKRSALLGLIEAACAACAAASRDWEAVDDHVGAAEPLLRAHSPREPEAARFVERAAEAAGAAGEAARADRLRALAPLLAGPREPDPASRGP